MDISPVLSAVLQVTLHAYGQRVSSFTEIIQLPASTFVLDAQDVLFGDIDPSVIGAGS